MTHLHLTIAFALVAAGCARPTQFVVHIDSDLEAGTELERIAVRTEELIITPSLVGDFVEFELDEIASDSIESRTTLPLSITIEPSGALPRRARIEATGYLAVLPGETEGRTVSRVLDVEFHANRTLGLVIRLDEDCLGVGCEASFTCDRGECVDAVAAGVPSVPSASAEPDADVDAPDASIPPCHPGTTPASDLTCVAVLCRDDEFVSSNECVPCHRGATNEAGDDASGPDTMCDGGDARSAARVNFVEGGARC